MTDDERVDYIEALLEAIADRLNLDRAAIKQRVTHDSDDTTWNAPSETRASD